MKLKAIILGIAVALAAAPGLARAAGFGGGGFAHGSGLAHGGGFAHGSGFAHAGPSAGLPRAGVGGLRNDGIHEHMGPYAHDGDVTRTPYGNIAHSHGDARRFGDRAMLEHWRGGHWFHGVHGGRLGWWWLVDGDWNYYPSPGYWYYCSDPEGYYPYVNSCSTAWQQVPDSALPPG